MSRSVKFFREAPLDEARAAKILVDEVMAERMRGYGQDRLPFPKERKARARQARVAAPPMPTEADANAAKAL